MIITLWNNQHQAVAAARRKFTCWRYGMRARGYWGTACIQAYLLQSQESAQKSAQQAVSGTTLGVQT
eukprot:1148169-Pelagomonas_calceolata.AAC.13